MTETLYRGQKKLWPVRGQRYEPTLLPSGKIFLVEGQLNRAEDKTGEVNSWLITLSPVFQKQVGADIAGQLTAGSGNYRCLMQWGGGGVTYKTAFTYPVAGAAFAVAGDNVMLSVLPTDLVTVFTEATKPCIVSWVAPIASPVNPKPITMMFANGAITEFPPFASKMTVTKQVVGATVAVTIDGTIVAQLSATDSELEIPVPSGALTFALGPSAGSAFAFVELCFS